MEAKGVVNAKLFTELTSERKMTIPLARIAVPTVTEWDLSSAWPTMGNPIRSNSLSKAVPQPVSRMLLHSLQQATEPVVRNEPNCRVMFISWFRRNF